MELFNVVLGRKKDPWKYRGKLTIERHRIKFFMRL